MFNAKHKQQNKVYQVLAVRFDEMYNKTYFLVWDVFKWKWIDSLEFVPPNWQWGKEKETD